MHVGSDLSRVQCVQCDQPILRDGVVNAVYEQNAGWMHRSCREKTYTFAFAAKLARWNLAILYYQQNREEI